MLKFAGILALLGGVTNLILGYVAFGDGMSVVAWLVAGGERPDPDAGALPIPLVFQAAAGICGVAGGIALLSGRGLAAKLASASLFVAGIAVVYARSVFGAPDLGEVSDIYARSGAMLVAGGLIGSTLPGVIAALALVPRRADVRQPRTATG